MISGESIVCMPLTSWDSDFPNTMIQLMQIISKENKVLLVDYQYTFKDLLNGLRGKRKVPVKRMLGFEKRLRIIKTKQGSELNVLTPPPILPYNKIRWKSLQMIILQFNAWIILKCIKRNLKKLNISKPIIINGYNPFLGLPLTGKLNEKLNIYFCYDEMKGDKFYSEFGPYIEELYLKKADCIVVTSDALFDTKSKINCNCRVVKNGVDFDLFNSVVANEKLLKSKKVIGYTGSIDERFDIETVKYSIECLPNVKFLFVGRVTNLEAKRALESFHNVEFIGGQNPDKVPLFIKEMDVCIIPYLKNEVTNGVYPLKINEYLAVGKPVVMTDFAKINELAGIVKISSDKVFFVNHLQESMDDDNVEKRNIRIDFARKNSWSQKAEELSLIINEFK